MGELRALRNPEAETGGRFLTPALEGHPYEIGGGVATHKENQAFGLRDRPYAAFLF